MQIGLWKQCGIGGNYGQRLGASNCGWAMGSFAVWSLLTNSIADKSQGKITKLIEGALCVCKNIMNKHMFGALKSFSFIFFFCFYFWFLNFVSATSL